MAPRKGSYDMAADTSDDRRSERSERDMILTTNEFIHVLDTTKGDVSLYVGPNKTSLATTDRPMLLDARTGRFKPCDLTTGTQAFVTAKEGEYIVLENPAEGDKFPQGCGKLTTPALRVGKTINIQGPATFALWPGQAARVVPGHSLCSNQYLTVRVYDENAAKANWQTAVIKKSSQAGADAEVLSNQSDADTPSAEKITMGKLFVIKGTEVSFYIPPTGIEVVTERVGGEERYVREAVTLERLEYCLLIDENGSKRYETGPMVVFPRPTETFRNAPIKSDPDKLQAKKFRAQELMENSGIHIRVIADYSDDSGDHKAGDELFITGREQTIYYPREEHAVIKYGDQDIHFGIAIPPGEARYVLNKKTGVIETVKGPQIFLADPRTQVIVQRALGLSLCELLFPGNQTALELNAQRLGITDQDITAGGGGNQLGDVVGRGYESYNATAAIAGGDSSRRIMIKGASKALPGDAFDRKNKFTAPRSIVLNTKYDGAVTVDVWPGFAMLLVSKSGERRVVEGPQTALLEYDESPQAMSLSTGKPKNTDHLLRTVFLQTRANMVSDIVTVETSDFCQISVKLSYRVNFEGDDRERWFAVDNYVKFLCDHMRSKVRSAAQKLGVEEFYTRHTDILRDIVLGKHEDGKPRTGTLFVENNMRIYDVEVLEVKILTPEIERLLTTAQRENISSVLLLAGEQRRFELVRGTEDLKRKIEEAQSETARHKITTAAAIAQLNSDVTIERTKSQLAQELATLEANAATAEMQRAAAATDAEAKSALAQLALRDEVTRRETNIALDQKQQAVKLEAIKAEVQAVVDKAKAISPDLVAALGSFGERSMIEKVAAAMAPMALIGGDSVIDVLKKLLAGTTIARQLEMAAATTAPADGDEPTTRKGRNRTVG